MRPRLLLLCLLAVAIPLACGGASSSLSAPPPTGPDAGAGCDSSIHGHCTFASGFPPETLLGQPVCVEYSGGSAGDPACPSPSSLQPPGEYASGPCSRSQYAKSCTFVDPEADAGTCVAYETIWDNSTVLAADAGIPGYPPCLAP